MSQRTTNETKTDAKSRLMAMDPDNSVTAKRMHMMAAGQLVTTCTGVTLLTADDRLDPVVADEQCEKMP
jgi:hypothetical protein